MSPRLAGKNFAVFDILGYPVPQRNRTGCTLTDLIQTWFLQLYYILLNLPKYQLKRLQRLQNSAARLITRSKGRHTSSRHSHLFQDPPSSSVSITSKQSTNIHTGPDTQYQTPPRQLRSSNTTCFTSIAHTCPHLPGTRSFSHIGMSLKGVSHWAANACELSNFSDECWRKIRARPCH